MLKAGYKANVIPQTAEAVFDCRVLPGRQAEFERTVDQLIGPDVTREWITKLDSYETTFDGHLVDAMNEAILAHDPEARTVSVHALRWNRREGIRETRHSLLRLRAAAVAARAGFQRAVPRRRRASSGERTTVRDTCSGTFPAQFLTST